MNVELIGHTVLTNRAYELLSPFPGGLESRVTDADHLAELAGRQCYEAWSRKRPETAHNKGYLANILRQEHESVLEHATATFRVTGVSRAMLLELERHRHLSFSVRSTRYVDESESSVVTPMLENESQQLEVSRILEDVHEDARYQYRYIVGLLMDRGYSRKRAREIARGVLPNATETRFIVSGNMRAWRTVIKRRIAPGADQEIQRFAGEVLRQLRQLAPNTFQDIADPAARSYA